MTWILLYWIVNEGMHSVEFNSQAACEAAARQTAEWFREDGEFNKWICVPKGDDNEAA